MNKTDAQEYAAELLEAAADGEWGSLLQIGLGADLLEHLRQLQQINTEITKLESREKQMNDSFVGRLQLMDFDDDPATDGGGSAPGVNPCGANGSTQLDPQKMTSRPTGANPSDANRSAQAAPLKPTGFDLSDLGVPQRRNVA